MIKKLTVTVDDYQVQVIAVDGQGNVTSGSILLEYDPDEQTVADNIHELVYNTIVCVKKATYDELNNGNGGAISERDKKIVEDIGYDAI